MTFRFVSQLFAPFRVDARDPELASAQLAVFTKQLPLLYFILCANSCVTALLFYGRISNLLGLYIPAGLVCASALRLFIWFKRGNLRVSPEKAGRYLQAVVILGALLVFLYMTWAIALYNAADEAHRTFVALYICLTGLASVVCLMHLRQAALAVTLALVGMFCVMMAQQGNAIAAAMAACVLLVGAALVYMLHIHSRDFASLVHTNLVARRLNEENARLANLDSLTDLPNRRQFFARLHDEIAKTRASNSSFTVGLIDLDGFKPVNDLYGHVTGDRLLVETGARLREKSSDSVFVARLGGDEFAVVITDPAIDAVKLAKEICASIAEPFRLPGVVTHVTASFGIASFPACAETAEELYENADYALYHCKQQRNGEPAVFTRELGVRMRENLVIEQRLREADLETEFVLQFQPLYDYRTGKPTAFEALARWNARDVGWISPAVFIPVAERSDLINKITKVLLNKALNEAKQWPEDIRLSFNLSMRDIASSEVVLSLLSIIRNSGFDPRRLDLEVTETALVSDFEKARDAILAFKSLGVRIALDDFGTGYSSLSYVHKLPFDKIKIDRSFVQELETDNGARDIVRTVIDLCRNLDLQCVQEGVETIDQANAMMELGCPTMQGYYFGRPMDADAAERLANESATPTKLVVNG